MCRGNENEQAPHRPGQQTRYTSPGVYVVGDNYYCAPSMGQRPPAGFGEWEHIATYYGNRRVYRALAAQSPAASPEATAQE